MTRPALRFPAPDWNVERSPRSPERNPLPALALILSILSCWVFWAIGYWSGRVTERGSQLGQVLALAPALDELHGAVLRSDSTLARLDALGRPQKRSLAALQRQRPPATPTDSLSRHP